VIKCKISRKIEKGIKNQEKTLVTLRRKSLGSASIGIGGCAGVAGWRVDYNSIIVNTGLGEGRGQLEILYYSVPGATPKRIGVINAIPNSEQRPIRKKAKRKQT